MKRLIKIFLYLFLLIFLVIALAGFSLWYFWSSNLPYIGSLRDYAPPLITEVYADNNEIIGKFWNLKSAF
jgi:penicillin-binding protein 1A